MGSLADKAEIVLNSIELRKTVNATLGNWEFILWPVGPLLEITVRDYSAHSSGAGLITSTQAFLAQSSFY